MGCHCLLQCMKVKSLSRVRLLATPWTVAYQAPLSMGFSRQEYWSGVPLPSPIKIDPNLTTGVLIKTGDVDTETHTQMYLHAKKPHRLLVNQPEAGREVWYTHFLSAHRGNQPYFHLGSSLQPPELRGKTLVLSSPRSAVLCYGSPSKLQVGRTEPVGQGAPRQKGQHTCWGGQGGRSPRGAEWGQQGWTLWHPEK